MASTKLIDVASIMYLAELPYTTRRRPSSPLLLLPFLRHLLPSGGVAEVGLELAVAAEAHGHEQGQEDEDVFVVTLLMKN